MRFIDFLEGKARSLGVILIPVWRACHLEEERHITRLLKHLEIDCVFDVGANVGQHAKKLRRHCGYQGLILSFEPNPVCFPTLQSAAAKDPLWHVFHYALGQIEGKAEFQAYADSLLGSMLEFEPTSFGAPKAMKKATISVDVETLAGVFARLQAEYGFKRPFLKLDTQGFDLQVALGAGDRLKEFLGLQSEVTFDPIYAGSPTFDKVVDYYQSQGFRLSKLFPNNDINFPVLVEMDVAMIRSDLVARSTKI